MQPRVWLNCRTLAHTLARSFSGALFTPNFAADVESTAPGSDLLWMVVAWVC